MGNIIYQIDENHNRKGTNWTGHFYEDSTPDNLWLYIRDEDGEMVSLKRGDFVRYSDNDLPINTDYEIVESNMGIYKVKEM